MKKTALTLGILLATPLFAFGYVGSDLTAIELQYNSDIAAHNIIYRMNDGVGLKSNLSTSAESENRTYNRLWNVTKNTAAFEDYTLDDMETLFDWDAFAQRRAAVISLVEVLITMGILEPTQLLEVLVLKETF